MMKQSVILLSLSFALTTAQAVNVGVVDSGTDLEHSLLQNSAWVNAGEVPESLVDEDGNGKVDDVSGWNFADQYRRTFFREHLNDINPLVYQLITIIAHQQAGTVTEEENKFFEEKVRALPDEQRGLLGAHLNYFGGYAHGTHVAGIVVAVNPDAKIMPARVFPDSAPPLYEEKLSPEMGQDLFSLNGVKPQGVMDWLYRLLANVASGTFHDIGGYLHETEMDVANYSLGMAIRPIAEAALKLRGNAEPTDEEVAAECQRLYVQFEREGTEWMSASPNTLFVVASGNDGSDNDIFPAFPSNLRLDNSISVAASHGYVKLAEFSNFGETTVDVAAPGVAMMSAVPSLDGKGQLPMSGTSMAAPFVTGAASLVKQANPALTPLEMRTILMGTVDVKDWLKGKVISEGVVNPSRAERAAELTLTMGLEEAITLAQTEVADMAEDAFAPQGLGTTPSFEVSEELKAAAKAFVF